MLNLFFVTLAPLLITNLPLVNTSPAPKTCEAKYYKHDSNVKDRYLVVLRDDYTLEEHYKFVGQKFEANDILCGYVADLSSDLFDKVRTDCGVQFVEDDFTGKRDFHRATSSNKTFSPPLTRRATQQDAPWPLVQMSAPQKNPTDMTNYYVDNPGEGVDIYILDSGINHPQDEFNDQDGNDRIEDFLNVSTDKTYDDTAPDDGHGTSVASALIGKTYGVAKSANLFNVKYEIEGEPDIGNALSAMTRIVARHNARKTENGFKGSIINMSWSVPASRTVLKTLERVYAAGISMVASGGNDGFDPSAFPSRNDRVISVGASNVDYVPRESSNYGKDEIELWAPGEDVPLCNKHGDEVRADGTSFAAGYVSGILAIFYGVEGKDMNPDLAKTRLLAQTDDWIDLPPGNGKNWYNSPKALANTGNRKGAAKDPPLVYIGGPKAAAATLKPKPTTTATKAPSPSPTDICGVQYEVVLDHFDIFGKNFNSTMMGTEGSGLKEAISGEMNTEHPFAHTLANIRGDNRMRQADRLDFQPPRR